MSKRQVRVQASSSRAAAGPLSGGFSNPFDSSSKSTFSSSSISYLAEFPDLSRISDPNVVVLLKNLSKKEDITRFKALQDLADHVSRNIPEDDGAFLDAWVLLYPRLSIDNSRKVRTLAHSILGSLGKAAGKRLAKHLPRLIGPWMTSCNEVDDAVARAAQESISTVFDSDAKRQNLKVAFQGQIVDFCYDTIARESPTTLSDERYVKEEDAKSKYTRVASAALRQLCALLRDCDSKTLETRADKWEKLVADLKVWELASYSDPQVRISTHMLVQLSVTKMPNAIEAAPDSICRAYLGAGLRSDQTRSSPDFLEALCVLTRYLPSIWTEHYKSKKSPKSSLLQFIRRGSQRGGPRYWESLQKLLNVLPSEVLPQDSETTAELLTALLSAATSKEESRGKSQDTDTLEAYVLLCRNLLQRFPQAHLTGVIEQFLWPLVSNYVSDGGQSMGWSMPESGARRVLESVFRIQGIHQVVVTQWNKISDDLISTMEKGTPVPQNGATEKPSSMTQTSLQVRGQRWAWVYKLARGLKNAEAQESLNQSVELITSRAIEFLTMGGGTNYGIASVLDSIISEEHQRGDGETTIRELVLAFLEGDLPGLLLTPAGPILSSTLYVFQDDSSFPSLWQDTVAAVFAFEGTRRVEALRSLIFPSRNLDNIEPIRENESIQSFLLEAAKQEQAAESPTWRLVVDSAKHPSRLSESSTKALLQEVAATENGTVRPGDAWKLADFLKNVGNGALQQVLKSPDGVHLFSTIIASDPLSSASSENVVDDLQAIEDRCRAAFQTLSILDQKALASSVIQENLLTAGRESPSVESLVHLASQVLENDKVDGQDASGLLPDPIEWMNALNHTGILIHRPSPLSAMSSPLGGAVYLVAASEEHRTPEVGQSDAKGYTVPLRMAMYYGAVVNIPGARERFPRELQLDLTELFLLSLRLANDNFDIPHCNLLWTSYDVVTRKEISAFLDDGNKLIQELIAKDEVLPEIWHGKRPEAHSFVYDVMSRLEKAMEEPTTRSLYSAVSYVQTMEAAAGVYGRPQPALFEDKIPEAWKRQSTHPISAAAMLRSIGGSLSKRSESTVAFNRLCAELSYSKGEFETQGLPALVTINAALSVSPELAQSVTGRRLAMFVQCLAQVLEEYDHRDDIRSEALQTLRVFLPCMIEMYGTYWSSVLDSIMDIWSTTTVEMCTGPQSVRVTLLHSTLRVYMMLRKEAQREEANEDLREALESSTGDIASSLIHLASLMAEVDDRPPIMRKENVNELLVRALKQLPSSVFPSPSGLFFSLKANSPAIQEGLMEILQGLVDKAQKEVSIETAVANISAELPVELMSGIAEPPVDDRPSTQPLALNWEPTSPIPHRAYIFAWLVVFAHFEASSTSFKVRTDYVEQLASTTAVKNLLDYAAVELGHTDGRPQDVSKFDIANGSVDDFEDEEKQEKQRLAHLYFLCLRHLPNKVREWWFTCPRQTSKSIEEWTEKYFSPLAIEAALKSVRDWADTMKLDNANEALSIKISPSLKQAVASYELDDDTSASILIRLPPSYPLRPAEALTDKRVGVNERKWQNWLLVTKGVMTFSNGSIVEGIVAWRKNINGSLKGQTECSICQSMISENNQFPNKKCGTCKNMFHAYCLHKWFQSSNSSTCPLCRQQFNYG